MVICTILMKTIVIESVEHTGIYVVIAWVFDFRKFITITDVSLQAMYIACAPIASLCSQDGFIHERHTKYLVPWMKSIGFEHFSV